MPCNILKWRPCLSIRDLRAMDGVSPRLRVTVTVTCCCAGKIISLLGIIHEGDN